MSDAVPVHETAALTRYIETRYHARHREQLPPLAKLAEMVEDLHFADEGVPHGLSGLLRQMIGALDAHMTREEQTLFPAIRSGDVPRLGEPIAAMREGHEHHRRELAEIRRLTCNLTPPDRACTSWCTLYAGLAEFADELTEHFRLENDVLFPRLKEVA